MKPEQFKKFKNTFLIVFFVMLMFAIPTLLAVLVNNWFLLLFLITFPTIAGFLVLLNNEGEL